MTSGLLLMEIEDMSMEASSKYQAGQSWQYRAREGEEHSRIVVLKTETRCSERILHITVVGDGVDSPLHMPFSISAMDKSVTEMDEAIVSLPEFETGYEIWREEYDKEQAGIYAIPVADVLDL